MRGRGLKLELTYKPVRFSYRPHAGAWIELKASVAETVFESPSCGGVIV